MLNTNLHPSVVPKKSSRPISKIVVLALASDCLKCGRKLPASPRSWKWLSIACGCDGQCWETGTSDICFSCEASTWNGVSGESLLLVERVTLHPGCMCALHGSETKSHSCSAISLYAAAKNQPVQRL